MAGGSVGTIFAELDLDADRYLKSQKKLLQDATSTTLNIEQNFKNLGVKSSAEMDLMRAKIKNSFDAIANSSKATANDIIRAEEAKNKKLQDLNDQQFGKQTSFLSSLKSHWMLASAAIYASVAAIGKAWDMMKVGADYDEQRGILDNLARKYETTADSIMDDMRRASRQLVADADLVKISMAGLAKGLNPDQLIGLAEAAEVLSGAVGVSATKALEDLTQALETGRTRGLKTYLGTALDLKEAFGELESKMTETEKAQAMYNMTMISAVKLQEQQTGAVDSAADKIERLEAKWKNLNLAVSRFVKETAVWWYDYFSAPSNEGASVRLPMPSRPKEADSFQSSNEALKEQLRLRKDNEQAIKDMAAASKKSAEDAIRAEKEYLKTLDESAKEEVKLYEWVHDYELELYADRLKESEKTTKKEVENIAKGLKEEEAAADKRLTVYRNIYKDLGELSDKNFDFQMDLLKKQAEEFEQITGDQALAAEWLAKKEKDLLRERDLAYGNFFDGIRVGFEDIQRAEKSWASQSHKIVLDMASTSRKTLSDSLFDAVTGDLKTFADYWESIWKSLARSTTDIIADMAVSAGSSLVKDLLGSAGSAIGNWAGDAIDWLFAAQGIWKAGAGAGGEVPVIAHEGEMIIPKTQADYLRATYGDFAGMMGGADIYGGTTGAGITAREGLDTGGMVGSFGTKAAGGFLGSIIDSMATSLIGGIPGIIVGDVLGGILGAGGGVAKGVGGEWSAIGGFGFGDLFGGPVGSWAAGEGGEGAGWAGYAKGTGPAGLPRTGLFYGHEGEIVLNPAQSARARGSTGNTERPLNITVVVAGREFEADVKTWADEVRVKAERRSMGVKRMYS